MVEHARYRPRVFRVWPHARVLLIVSHLIWLGASGCRVASRPTVVARSEPWTDQGLNGRRVTTEHFEIVSTVHDAEFEDALPEFMESAHERYTNLLAARSPSPQRLVMYLFGNRSEWERFTRRSFPTRYEVYSRIRYGGFTDGGMSVLFYVDRPTTMATLAHEGWHQYLAAQFGTAMPAWLNEGLACTFETTPHEANQRTTGERVNTFRIGGLRDAIRNRELLSLPELLATSSGEVVGQDDSRLTQTYYAQAWALVTMLRSQEPEGFRRLLQDVEDDVFRVNVQATRLAGASPGSSSEADAVLRAYFGCSTAELEPRYRKYILSLVGFSERRGE